MIPGYNKLDFITKYKVDVKEKRVPKEPEKKYQYVVYNSSDGSKLITLNSNKDEGEIYDVAVSMFPHIEFKIVKTR